MKPYNENSKQHSHLNAKFKIFIEAFGNILQYHKENEKESVFTTFQIHPDYVLENEDISTLNNFLKKICSSDTHVKLAQCNSVEEDKLSESASLLKEVLEMVKRGVTDQDMINKNGMTRKEAIAESIRLIEATINNIDYGYNNHVMNMHKLVKEFDIRRSNLENEFKDSSADVIRSTLHEKRVYKSYADQFNPEDSEEDEIGADILRKWSKTPLSTKSNTKSKQSITSISEYSKKYDANSVSEYTPIKHASYKANDPQLLIDLNIQASFTAKALSGQMEIAYFKHVIYPILLNNICKHINYKENIAKNLFEANISDMEGAFHYGMTNFQTLFPHAVHESDLMQIGSLMIDIGFDSYQNPIFNKPLTGIGMFLSLSSADAKQNNYQDLSLNDLFSYCPDSNGFKSIYIAADRLGILSIEHAANENAANIKYINQAPQISYIDEDGDLIINTEILEISADSSTSSHTEL